MPGVVKSILCVAGESVAEGANIVTLEAMKMQNPLFAPMSGIVRDLSECIIIMYQSASMIASTYHTILIITLPLHCLIIYYCVRVSHALYLILPLPTHPLPLPTHYHSPPTHYHSPPTHYAAYKHRCLICQCCCYCLCR